jgi:hypothetical protein
VQASTALPIFYKPTRINGVDYLDGGIRHTANIDIAIEKGADLIVCYNPFRPFLNRIEADDGRPRYFAAGRYLSDRGLKVVMNQAFRTLLHSRLKLGLQRYLADDRFQGDIVLLEPRERTRLLRHQSSRSGNGPNPSATASTPGDDRQSRPALGYSPSTAPMDRSRPSARRGSSSIRGWKISRPSARPRTTSPPARESKSAWVGSGAAPRGARSRALERPW